MAIDPKYLTLDDLFRKKLFTIPEYQRAYSWQSKQRKDLFNDIEKLYEAIKTKPDRHHFMATIVCLDKGHCCEVGTDQYSTYDIVDGQQRLTTLIVLLKAISNELKKSKLNEEKIEAEKLERLLVKGDKRLILLQTNHDSSRLFRTYLENGQVDNKVVDTLGDYNLINAFKDCKKFVEKWKRNYKLMDLLRLLKNRITFIFYVSNDEGSVFSTFEVLNSRGLDVDWLDKCKTMLMGIAFENLDKNVSKAHISEIHKRWSNIYRVMGVRDIQGSEILRFAATLKQSKDQNRPISAEDSTNYFRQVCTKKPTNTLDVSEFLLTISEKLQELVLNNRISGITDIIQARILAVSILLADEWNEEQRKEALKHWENVTFRIFGLADKDARTKVGEYTRLACRIYSYYNKSNKAKDAIKEIIKLGDEEEYRIENVIENLRNNDCYNGWSNYLRYFLFRYEEHLAKEAGATISNDIWEGIWEKTASDTIEHIRPVKWNASGWRGILGRSKDRVDSQVHRLGNLMILPAGINSKANDKSFTKKKRLYEKYSPILQVKEVLKENRWSGNTIKKREDKMISWAKEYWS